ncbi:hypothetical protein Pedsa_3435 [Pseudopedobacter saltans DSM 12145]|uniref:Uncharacterized protein n=1 Tax=Pseudopedobacter saltans (strain ATCC 51119 / DSM 12145 / JCM 21818 / CCUG 39354 / LMG 10337 / NBRC 100064 / NCIMB 13643) TaxID=762903 RepID=F0SDI6_PSESL|nr:hypothetical protein [Pseudopedobacter saltans]ADY53969.1 hypothetical protein Pedsa_3435 [Pseudopedobacter saltans DSM 12145]
MSDYTFYEKQYLGRDYIFISIRLVMAIFCFMAYYWTENRDINADLLLLVGCFILIASVIMLFILHFRTRIKNKAIILDGLWTTRLVKIDLNSISKVEKTQYSSFFINNPVYNLHKKGAVRFYAGGKDAVKLTDRDGLIYVIGSQKAGELYSAIINEMKK